MNLYRFAENYFYPPPDKYLESNILRTNVDVVRIVPQQSVRRLDLPLEGLVALRIKEEDEKNASRIEAKSKLENYCFSLKNSINDEKLQISSEDKATIQEHIDITLKWLDDNQNLDKEEYDSKYSEIQAICSPIMSKVHSAAGGMPGTGDTPGHPAGGMSGTGNTPEPPGGGMPGMAAMSEDDVQIDEID